MMTCTTYPDLGNASDWLKEKSLAAQPIRALPRSGECTSSVWDFCARYSDVVLRGLKRRPREMSAVLSGYTRPGSAAFRRLILDKTPEKSLAAQLIRSTTKIWIVHVIRMELLGSLLRRRLRRLKWRPREMSAVLSGYTKPGSAAVRRLILD